MNITVFASQVTWPLQLVISLTFAVPLTGLALLLRRPAASSLAMGWAWTIFALVGTTWNAFFGAQAISEVTRAILSIVAFGVGASVPAFTASVDALTTERIHFAARALLMRSLAWGAAFAVIVFLAGPLQLDPIAMLTNSALGVARFLLLVSYALIAWYTLRRRRSAPAGYRVVLLLFATALIIQALRPLAAALVFKNASAGTIAEPRAITFVVVNVFITTVFGLACILMALAEERVFVIASGHQLRDAALRVERAERLESVGRLATGVAHDFNNFLMIIKSGTALARDRYDQREVPDEELQAIDEAADRGAALTRQLLTFARQQPQEKRVFDAAERVRQLQDLLARMVGRTISLTVDMPDEQVPVNMDPTQFEQVVVNLVSNARNAMPPAGGRINVRLAVVSITRARPLDVGELAVGEYLSLEVRDTGTGIPPAVMPRIFDPFFTTRQDDGGTGMGLSTVQGIARQSGGDVTVESTVGVGTTFTVLLPCVVAQQFA